MTPHTRTPPQLGQIATSRKQDSSLSLSLLRVAVPGDRMVTFVGGVVLAFDETLVEVGGHAGAV
jgi:hypothetical protein